MINLIRAGVRVFDKLSVNLGSDNLIFPPARTAL